MSGDDQGPRSDPGPARRGFSRRSFLRRGATGALVAAGAATGVAGATGVFGPGSKAGAAPGGVVFHGAHQGAILTAPARSHAIVSLDIMTESPAELTALFRTLTSELRTLMDGGPATEAFNAGIAGDNGMLGPVIPARQLTPTVSVGASLFDGRFGLATRRPASLTTMEAFPNDDLDPVRCNGDLNVTLEAADIDTVTHALRRIMQATDGVVQPRWRLDGFTNPPRPSGKPRNLFGFNDGVSNPEITDPAQMDALVWARRDGSEPAWTAGGTYQVIRVIRQIVEFWDRVSVEEQELMVGRRRDSGAPLGTDSSTATPDFSADPEGSATPLSAHIRLANPRTTATADSRILRRSVNYDVGLDVNGNLDMGLIFVCYQQDIRRQFAAVQTRLIDEPMVDYISPVGGGYFFTLPGVTDVTDYYARALLTA